MRVYIRRRSLRCSRPPQRSARPLHPLRNINSLKLATANWPPWPTRSPPSPPSCILVYHYPAFSQLSILRFPSGILGRLADLLLLTTYSHSPQNNVSSLKLVFQTICFSFTEPGFLLSGLAVDVFLSTRLACTSQDGGNTQNN